MESSRAILKNMRENDDIDKIKLLWQTTSDLRHKDLRDISTKDDEKIKENFIKFMARWPSYSLPLGKALVIVFISTCKPYCIYFNLYFIDKPRFRQKIWKLFQLFLAMGKV